MTRVQRIELAAGVILVAGALAAAAYWGRSGPPGRADAFPVTRPAKAPPALGFELPDLSGPPVRLETLRGRVVLLNFWATWCGPCRDEMPALDTLARELGPRGLTVLGVNFKDPRPDVETFVKDQGLRFPILLDEDGAVGKRYQVFALPTTLVVDREGQLVGSVLGLRDWTGVDARAYLATLLGRPGA